MGLSLRLKLQEREADNSASYSAAVKNAWSYTSTPQYAFMTWCSVKKKSTGTTLPLPRWHMCRERERERERGAWFLWNVRSTVLQRIFRAIEHGEAAACFSCSFNSAEIQEVKIPSRLVLCQFGFEVFWVGGQAWAVNLGRFWERCHHINFCEIRHLITILRVLFS
jgi:hypothetical protein